MQCEEFCEMIAAYIDSQASPEEEKALLDHLNHCPRCKAMLESHATLKTMICACHRIAGGKLDIDVSKKVMSKIMQISDKNN